MSPFCAGPLENADHSVVLNGRRATLGLISFIVLLNSSISFFASTVLRNSVKSWSSFNLIFPFPT